MFLCCAQLSLPAYLRNYKAVGRLYARLRAAERLNDGSRVALALVIIDILAPIRLAPLVCGGLARGPAHRQRRRDTLAKGNALEKRP